MMLRSDRLSDNTQQQAMPAMKTSHEMPNTTMLTADRSIPTARADSVGLDGL
jgi:hypothetical protein